MALQQHPSIGNPASSSGRSFGQRRILPSGEVVAREAGKVEALIQTLVDAKLNRQDITTDVLEKSQKLKNINSLSKQIVLNLLRSNDLFRGFKVNIKQHIVRPELLLLAGTLCETFDVMNTSPFYGYRALMVGCGALSSYSETKVDSSDLIERFYGDRPPVTPEVMQILGAKVTGIEPRENSKAEYEYSVSYRHVAIGFQQLEAWLSSNPESFDVLTCFNLFGRPDFLFHYSTPEQITQFLRVLRRAIAPEGLLYSSPPLLPVSSENRSINAQIFYAAGFQTIYQGYYYILEPVRNLP